MGELRQSTPADEGVDARGISQLVDALETDPAIRPHALVLLRHGAVIARGGWAPYAPDRVQLLYSLSKSFTSSAAGLARAEGQLELDTPVIDYFPELDAEITDPRTRRMTVRNIASMASGHAGETLDQAIAASADNFVRGFLQIPLDAEPGTLFAYNQPCTYTLAAIVQRATGQSLIDYLRPRLFDPLGIAEAYWVEHPAGTNIGFSGLHAAPDAVARLGQLYLQRGRWGGTQLLDESWVAEASRVQVANDNGGTADWALGYGLQFWMSQHGYRGDGAFGQFCLVLPEHDAVLALTTETNDMQRVLTAVWQHLIPAFDGEVDRGADGELADRLVRTVLPHPSGLTTVPPDFPTTFRASAGSHGIREVRLDAVAGYLTLADERGDLEVPIVSGGWQNSIVQGVPIAASGAFGPDGFASELLVLDTPHTLSVTCRPDGTADVHWLTEPLHRQAFRAQRRP